MDAADFTLTPELDGSIARAAGWLREARSVVALTGAGLSVESGIPPFRGPGGLWTKYGEPPLDGYQRFMRDPAKAWRDRLRFVIIRGLVITLEGVAADGNEVNVHHCLGRGIRRGVLSASGGRAGLPACCHAPMMIEATPVIAALRRRSSTGMVPVANASK